MNNRKNAQNGSLLNHLSWSLPDLLLKDTGKVLGRLEAALIANLLDGQFRVAQQFDRLVDAELVQVL